jgi:hypothetical protein
LREQLGLLPRREVTALVNLVVIDELWICLLCPTPRGLILLAGKNTHCHRNGDALGVEKATLIFPVETLVVRFRDE